MNDLTEAVMHLYNTGVLDNAIKIAVRAYRESQHDWGSVPCGACGYWIGKESYKVSRGCCKYPSARQKDSSCPDYVPREVPG